MEKLHIPKQEITYAIKWMSLLTVIPVNELKKYAIPFIRSMIEDREDFDENLQKNWCAWWEYFMKEWMRNEEIIRLFNYTHIIDFRTNV